LRAERFAWEMISLEAFLKDYVQFSYSVPEIVECYEEWVSEVKYMILSRWNQMECRNEVFAAKCAKRGNDVYRWNSFSRVLDDKARKRSNV